VKPGNQTSLNAAQAPFATYINGIHNRLHPIFAEEFLAALESLPKTHAMNQDLVTHIEIVLSRDQGRIVRRGVTKASGVTAFDIAAINAVDRSQPFGKAPDIIVSPDGNVYLHWEFHRDPFDACTTRNARPFLLKAAPPAPVMPGPPKRAPSGLPADDRPPGAPPPLLPLRTR
jgi:TonB-like protein